MTHVIRSALLCVVVVAVLGGGVGRREAYASIQNGVGSETISVSPKSGQGCANVDVAVSLNAGTGFVSFTHPGAVATSQSVTSTYTANPQDDGTTNTVEYDQGMGGVEPTGGHQVSGTSVAVHTAVKSAGPPQGATAKATVTYQFTVDDCVYEITLVVSVDGAGRVTHSYQ